LSKNLKTYLLLAIVLLIWGIIGFKVVSAISKEPEVPMVEARPTMLPRSIVKKDTFKLVADYRDPFLGTLPKSKKKPVKRTVQKKPVAKRNIIYSGLVSQTGSGNTMFFVSIDGQQYIMSKSQEIDGVRLLKGNDKNITVRYDGRSETILLQ
jgi:hypothetical protein